MQRAFWSFVLVIWQTAIFSPQSAFGQTNQPAARLLKDRGVYQEYPNSIELLSPFKQLTFVGSKSGEGYFSPDSEWMVFQSERDSANPFYQIYLTDLLSGETQRVSPGNGKTTCAWIHPSKTKVLYSSTHEDPNYKQKEKEEWDARKNPKARSYSWSFDDQMQIYEHDLATKTDRALLRGQGYHAEGSYSPDGNWIAFASNRHAYKSNGQDFKAADLVNGGKSKCKSLEVDSSCFIDIYLMKSDGTEFKRLTFEDGYDGGPFFSPDGKRIVWRHFETNGQVAEIRTMKTDGTDVRTITKMNAMAWAPFYHPSGDIIIFTSNILSQQNFELFAVDAEGKSKPVRITHREGFDGLPVFLPNGNQLSWTIRNSQGQSQIVIANWNENLVREALNLPAPTPKNLSQNILEQDVRAWIDYLADPNLQGRMTGSEQENEWNKQIAAFFNRIGYAVELNEFQFPFGTISGGKQFAKLISKDGQSEFLKEGIDFKFANLSIETKPTASSLVFAGYGLQIEDEQAIKGLDSYAGLNAHGRWVVVLKDLPKNITKEQNAIWSSFTSTESKVALAKKNGAAGVVLVGIPKNDSTAFQSAGIPVIYISDSIWEKISRATFSKNQIFADLLEKGSPVHFSLSNSLEAFADLSVETRTAHNVIARRPGVPAEQPAILMGAHGDHLGVNPIGKSLAQPEDIQNVHPGADDNASGVAVVLELAHAYASRPENMIFAIWSGEEFGIIGSSNFLKTNKTPIKVALNFDMVGRLRNVLNVQGLASSPQLRPIVEKLSYRTDLKLNAFDDPYLPSDSMSLYLNKIPIIDFSTGSHAEYHTPKNRRELINVRGVVQIAEFAGLLIEELIHAPRIDYQDVGSSGKTSRTRKFRVFLGTIPAYESLGGQGVELAGVSPNSPAAQAGLQKGDRIIEMNGSAILSVQDFGAQLGTLVPGKPVLVVILRDQKRLEFEITPEAREE